MEMAKEKNEGRKKEKKINEVKNIIVYELFK